MVGRINSFGEMSLHQQLVGKYLRIRFFSVFVQNELANKFCSISTTALPAGLLCLWRSGTIDIPTITIFVTAIFMSVGSFTWVKETILAEGNPSINDKSNIEY